jgi:hypothetical protein
MLREIAIRNFRSLKDVKVPLAPLTVVVGQNSAGKSCFISALLLLKQTLDSRRQWMMLAPEGNWVHLGGYRDFIFKHNMKRKLSFTLTFRADVPFSGRVSTLEEYAMEQQRRLPWKRTGWDSKMLRQLRDFTLELTFAYSHELRSVVSRIHFAALDGLVQYTARRRAGSPRRGNYYDVTYRESQCADARVSRTFQFCTLRKFFDLLVYHPAYSGHLSRYQQVARLEWLNSAVAAEMERLYRQTHYIGPVRERTHRTYIGSIETPEEVGPHGEGAVSMLLADRRSSRDDGAFGWTMQWLKRLGIASAVTIPDPDPEYAFGVNAKHPKSGVSSSLADNGFGLSQVLPIIVQAAHSEPGSVLVVEQPEIHLHPEAQATLADMLIDIYKKRRVRVLVETHSEHLIRRLQLRVAERRLKRDRVSVLLFDMTRAGTSVTKLAITEDGRRDQWPAPFVEGFMNMGLRDAVALSVAQQRHSAPAPTRSSADA